MDAKARIERALRQLTSLADAGERTLAIDVDTGRIECMLTAVDTIGCAALRIALQTPRLADATVDDLRALGGRLAERLRYLLEPIGALEVDGEGLTLQMRSSPPQTDPSGASYYELVARRGGEIALLRYQKTTDQPRHAISMELTREVLLRLLVDLADAVND